VIESLPLRLANLVKLPTPEEMQRIRAKNLLDYYDK
jgi:hypothetical protein